MALQTSGAISLNDIQTEFGGSNPISLSEYYGAASGIPSSGAISMNQFYGKSSGISITFAGSSNVGELICGLHQQAYKQAGKNNIMICNTGAFGSLSNIYANGGSSGTYVINLGVNVQADGKLNFNNFNLTLSSAATFSGIKLTHSDGRSYCFYKGSAQQDFGSNLIRGFRANGTEMSPSERGIRSTLMDQGNPHTAAQGWSGVMVGAVTYNWAWAEEPLIHLNQQSEAFRVLQKFAGNIIDKTLSLEWL